ncbi:hypothetical protein, partial [Neisseria meningitidis]|uniref:hypothetical protein n=1 Tax=Neisseria meningitidis TaxID=487 RepID=UPI00197C03C4
RNRTNQIPACAGMTNFRLLFLVFYFCENNGISACGYLPEKTETAPPSFPRRRESRHSMLRQFIGND